MAVYDAGDARLRIVPDASSFRKDLDTQLKGSKAEFVVQVAADAERAREQIRALRQEQEAQAVHLRVQVNETRAREQVDRMRTEQESRAIHLRVDVDESARSRLSASVERARQQAQAAAEKLSTAEQRLNDLREQHAAQINPMLVAAENALQRAREKGNPEGIARTERNLNEMRKALGGTTQELSRAEESVASARRQAQSSGDNLARTIENETQKARDLSRELKTLGKDFETAFPVSHVADSFSSMAPLISMLPLLATGFAEAAGAAEQLGGAVLGWPGMFAALGASFGTLLTGIHGVTDAYKALSTSAKDSGADQVSQARETRDANEQLASATRAQGNAERERSRAIRDSRQEMQDLNLQLRGGQLDTASAILEAQKARRDLATGHYNDGLDYQEAQLRVQQADLRVSESLSSQNKLRERSGDIGDRVVSANEQVAAANDRVAKAQEHLNDVTNKTSASQRALNTAMQQLAPNAQEFVKTIFELAHSGPLKELQNDTQQNLFAGMSGSIKNLVNSDLPTLKSGMGSVATSMNADFKQLFSSLGSDHTKGILSAILGDTSHAQDLLKTAIDPLINAFGTLAKAGSDTIPRMADGIGRAADRFSKFIDAADKDGRLDAWINGGITGFTHLGDIFVNLGQSLNGITKALGGQGFLATLEDATKHLDIFLNSTKGQDDLRRIFADGRAELEQLKPILEALPSIFKSAFGAATDGMGVWMPLLREATTLLKDFPGLTQGIFEGFLLWKSLSPVFSLVGDGLGFLEKGLGSVQTQITNSRVLAGSEMSTTASIFKKVAGEEGVGKLTGALNSLSGLAGPVGFAAVTAAIPIAIAAFDQFTNATKQAKDAADQLNQQEMTLEGTLDRVTGKITASTRGQAWDAAQNFNQGGKGGGIPGLSQGKAGDAASSLGISRDTYTSALTGDQGARQNVLDTLVNNNLKPEIAANANLTKLMNSARAESGGKLTEDDVIAAMLGEPGAVQKYQDAIKAHIGSDVTGTDLDLTHIDQQFSARGQSSLLAGLAITHGNQTVTGAQGMQQDRQQAIYGNWRLSSQGTTDLGLPANTSVRAADDGYHVSPGDVTPQLADKLKALNITPQKNFDGSTTFVLPLGSRDVEKYDKGGPTPAAVGPLPDGGHPAIVHKDEWMANALGRRTLGDSFLGAANKGDIDLGLLPHFDDGGPGPDPDDPMGMNFIGAGPVQGDELGPTGPSPSSDGPQGVLPALVTGLSSAAQAGGSDTNMASGLPGPGGAPKTFTEKGPNPMLGMPGLWGLIGVGNVKDPQMRDVAQQAWNQQTLGWLGNWAGKFAGGLASDVYGMGLGSVGLGQSVLNPQNPWTQAGSNFLGGLLGKFGIGGGSGSGGSGSGGASGGLGGIFSSLLAPHSGKNPDVSSILQSGQPLDPNMLNQLYHPGGAPGSIGAGSALLPGAPGTAIGVNERSQASALRLGAGGGTTTGAFDDAVSRGAETNTPLYAPGTNTGGYGNSKGLPQWAVDLGARYGLAPSTYPDGGTLHQRGFAFDFAPIPGNSDPSGSMDRFAAMIQQTLGPQTLELIHSNSQTGQKWGVAGGRNVGPGTDQPGYFSNDWGNHDDFGGNAHVHWATDVPPIIGPDVSSILSPGAAPSGFSRPPGTDWDAIHAREAASWNTNTGNGYYGGLQFDQSTWEQFGGLDFAQRADLATADQQKTVAERVPPQQRAHRWPNTYSAGAPKLFDTGFNAGYVPPGTTVVQNNTGKNEAIFTNQQIETFKALGDANNNVAQQMKPPGPQVPDIQRMQPNARSQAPSAAAQRPGVGIGPGSGDAPAQGAQLAPAAAGQPQQNQVNTLGAGPLTAGSVGSSQTGMHVAPALQTGIMSAANTIGGLASTAISAAASAGSFGAGGAAGGAAGSLVAGLFTQAGKIAVDIANVPSSFMVSNWTGKGASPNASGAAYHPQQQPLATAHVNTTNYNGGINGHNMDDVITQMNIRDSQQQQSAMANTRAWP